MWLSFLINIIVFNSTSSDCSIIDNEIHNVVIRVYFTLGGWGGGANASGPNIGGGGASITILLYKYHISYHIFKGTANKISRGGEPILRRGGGGGGPPCPPEMNPGYYHTARAFHGK